MDEKKKKNKIIINNVILQIQKNINKYITDNNLFNEVINKKNI